MVRILAEVICTTLRPKFRIPINYFFYLHKTIRQKYMVLFYLIFILYTTIRPKIRVLIDLFPHSLVSSEICSFLIFIISFMHDHSTKARVFTDVFLLIVYDHSTKNICSSFIYFFFCARQFDKKLDPSLICIFYLCTTIRPKIRVLINLFLLCAHGHSTKNWDSH